jgi:hypothetical protein
MDCEEIIEMIRLLTQEEKEIIIKRLLTVSSASPPASA